MTLRPFGLVQAVAALGLLVASPALAQPAPSAYGPESIRIAHGDLDLATADGAREMLHRIRQAAVTLCARRPVAYGQTLEAIDQFDTCWRETVRQAVERLGDPRVAELSQPRGRPERQARR